MPSATNRVTTNHDEIRRWAEARGGRPACVKQTGGGGDVGILRIDFPGYSDEDSLEEISWDEWFDKFDERGLALLFQETSGGGQRSNFNKLVNRATREQPESDRGHRPTSRTALGAGSPAMSSGSRSRSGQEGATRSRNQNRSEGRASRRKTTARAVSGEGRSSSRSASIPSSSARARRSGRSADTGTRTSSASSSRHRKEGMRTSKSRSPQGSPRSNSGRRNAAGNKRGAASASRSKRTTRAKAA